MSNTLLLRRRELLLKRQEEEEMNIRAVCFKADGEQTVTIKQVNISNAKVFQYSYDGVTWENWDLTPLPFGGPTKVYVRGYNKTLSFDSSHYEYFSFSTDAYVYVSGIVESLLDGDNEVLTYGAQGILRQLFYQQKALRSAENLRFEAMSNSEACYGSMFNGCSNLLSAPELPATKLGYSPYRSMFSGCTSLVKAPSILPAITIGSWAYASMFNGCTSLEEAPELPAETLQPNCYNAMFSGCTNLKTIRCHAKKSATDATYLWMDGVRTAGTFYGHSEYGWPSNRSGIPTTWTFEELTD